MANGVIEIHDPFNGHNGISSNTDPNKKTDISSENAEDMIEYRILMAYATRRRPKEATESEQDNCSTPNGSIGNGTPPVQTEIIEKKKKKKRKIWKRLPRVLTCLKPQTKEDIVPPGDGDSEEGLGGGGGGATFRSAEEPKEDHLEEVAARLAEISDDIPFVRPDLETDSPDDKNVEKVIGLLLREAGDKLNESEELKDMNMADLLGNYSFFERVIIALLKKMGLTSNTDSLGPKVSPKTQIAVTCEATSRLSVLDTLPMNRLLGHGARFLKTHFSSWAEQNGGYENAFESEDEEEEVQ